MNVKLSAEQSKRKRKSYQKVLDAYELVAKKSHTPLKLFYLVRMSFLVFYFIYSWKSQQTKIVLHQKSIITIYHLIHPKTFL